MNSNTNTPNNENFIPERKNIIEFLYNYISKIISPLFIKLNFSANFVTIISGLIGVFGSLLILFNSNFYNILAFIFLNIFVVLDLVDGDIARYNNSSSLFGRWLDLFFDKLNEILFISILSYAAYMTSEENIYLILGFLLITMHFLYQYIILANLYWFSGQSKNIKIKKNDSSIKQIEKRSIGNFILVHFTMKHATLFFVGSIFVLFGEYHFAIFFLSIIATFSVFLSCLRNFLQLK